MKSRRPMGGPDSHSGQDGILSAGIMRIGSAGKGLGEERSTRVINPGPGAVVTWEEYEWLVQVSGAASARRCVCKPPAGGRRADHTFLQATGGLTPRRSPITRSCKPPAGGRR